MYVWKSEGSIGLNKGGLNLQNIKYKEMNECSLWMKLLKCISKSVTKYHLHCVKGYESHISGW